MALAWFGNPDWDDDHPPCYPVAVKCTQCQEELIWWRPVNYRGGPPKHEYTCNGVVVLDAQRHNQMRQNELS